MKPRSRLIQRTGPPILTAMPKAPQATLLALRELPFTAGPFALLAAGLLWGAYQLLQPNPARTVVLATGVPQGAYDGFGKRYAALLARHGITVQLRNTQGSAENLALLQRADSGVDIAFVQGGTRQQPDGDAPETDHTLQSLGRMFHEPVWLFYRTDSARRLTRSPQITRLAQLAGGTLNVGAPGSGVPLLLQALLEANRIAPGTITLQQQPTTPAVVDLLAPTAALVAREGLHPALVQLFVQAAQQVHGGAGWFQRKGEFPNAGDSEWPLAPEAQRYYSSGPPWLQRFLPFWLANLADRMWLALLAIVAVLIPLARVLPPVYEFRIRRRVFRWYAQLRAVDEAVGRRPAADLLAELADIEARVGLVTVPLSYADELYALRGHIDMVRHRLQAG